MDGGDGCLPPVRGDIGLQPCTRPQEVDLRSRLNPVEVVHVVTSGRRAERGPPARPATERTARAAGVMMRGILVGARTARIAAVGIMLAAAGLLSFGQEAFATEPAVPGPVHVT